MNPSAKLRKFVIVAGSLLLLFAVYVVARFVIHFPRYYYQDAIRSQVVDNQTLKPIQGAAVVAIWMAGDVGSIHGSRHLYRFDEAVTNDSGWFEIAGWSRSSPYREGHLTDEDPLLVVYKPGYKPLYLDNTIAYVERIGLFDENGRRIWVPVHTPRPGQVVEKYPGWRWKGRKRYCFWNGKRIGMDLLRSPEEHAWALDGAGDNVASRVRDYRRVPNFWRVWRQGYQALPPEQRATVLSPDLTFLGKESPR